MASADYGSLSSSISIVLGVLTYFLTILYGASAKLLAEDIPPQGQAVARRALRARLWCLLLVAELPLFLAFTTLFYLCLPTALTVVHTSPLSPWAFDLRRTLFVFLELAVAGCCLFVGIVGLRLCTKLCRCYADA